MLQHQSGRLTVVCRGLAAMGILAGVAGCQPVLSLSGFVPSGTSEATTEPSQGATSADASFSDARAADGTAIDGTGTDATPATTPEVRTSQMETPAGTSQGGSTAETSLGPAIRAQAGRPLGQQLLERGIKSSRRPIGQQP